MSEDKDSSNEDIVDGSSAAMPEPSTVEEPDLLPTVHVTTSTRGTSGVPSPSQSASAAPSINTAGSQRQSAAISLTGSESELAIADTDLQSNFDLLRDFPGSATILNQTYLEREGVSALRDLTGSSPNFTTFDGGGNRMTSISVRGVREQNYQSAPDVLPSTAFYIDDVPSLTTLGRVTVFNNIGSVTIAKGPQNTGYGLSLVGGVIDVRTPEATEVATAYAEGSYGNYDAYEVTAGLSTPIFKEALYLSLDGVLMGRDGFYDNIARNGEPYGDKSARGGRARLTAVPWDNVTIDYNYQSEDFRDQADPYIFNPLTNPDPFVVNFDTPGHEDITQSLNSLRVRAELDAADVMSVTAYRRSTWDYRADAIQFGLPFADFIGVTNEVIGSFTQEFRAASNNDPTEMGWTAGLLFARTKMDYEAGFLFNNGAPAGPPAIAETVARDVGVYGGVSVPLNSLVTVQGGLRYDWAGREGINEFAPPAISRGDEEFGEVLPSVSLVYSANDSVSYFAKYARAFKPGGFNVRTFATDPFSFEYGEETSDNVEVGFRALGLSGKFELSGAFFYSKFHDFQDLTQLSPTTFGISNADSARSFGAELDAAYMLMPSLKLFGTFGYTNAQYESYDFLFLAISVETPSASRLSLPPHMA